MFRGCCGELGDGYLSMFGHIIFDLDGTLLNTIDDLAAAGNYVCASRGWPVHTVDAYKHMVGNGIPKLVERFAPAGTAGDALAQATAQFSAYYDAHKEDRTAPYPGVPELLAALKGLGAHNEAALFVGDSDVDVRTGKNGGLTAVGVLWGFRDRAELERAGADHIIERPEQMLALVQENGA